MKKMARNRRFSLEKRLKIIKMVKMGLSYRKIAEKMKCCHRTVSRLHVKYKKTNSVATVKGQGRKKVTSEREDRLISRLIVSGECDNATQVRRNLSRNNGVNISSRTIRRRLRKVGLRARVKCKKPRLSTAHTKHRLEWAKERVNWGENEWKKVLWSDEKKFKLFGSDGKEWCYKRNNEPLSLRTTRGTVKWGGGGIMVWGCFSRAGVGKLHKIDSIMDSNMYQRILRYKMKSSARSLFGNSPFLFQQDNDPKHTSSSTVKFLERTGVDVMSWPSQSPDLNPIEHLWFIVDRKVRENHKPMNMNELWENIQEEWSKIPLTTCQKLVDSMPKRCQEVIRAKGHSTKY